MHLHRGIKTAVAVASAAATLLLGTGGSASAVPSYPVPYTLAPGVLQEATAPGTPPPGSDDFSCKPSASHPEPVVLVHGLLADQTDNWPTVSPLLADAGYCVFSLTYGADNVPFPLNQTGGLIPMEQSAQQLSAFVDRVLAATGARKVDLVGHSEGATMPEYYVKFLGGAAKVDHYVGVAGVLHGTSVDGLAALNQIGVALTGQSVAALLGPVCASCGEFLTGSNFIRTLDAGGLAAPGVRYTMIATRYDELVQPYDSGFFPEATNITVQDQCPLDLSEHLSVITDPTTGADILNALDPAHPVPVPCQLVLPFLGE
ncbi:hypothetical protein K6U06_21700 [Acidiferrimicrobium sp. IK]|uniref:esterase/lipase family protein n=1 Tax=Acidiferrimicrobium sp. IK TaxID=2871700 RepID=UPI0021CB8C3C|nr:alpha/beta fold hydrolase [Acidiferrimicrobium sp. IK]MCU4186995.1 hypothetical protein [Acidiferrimicrobium sp. IK]